MGEGWIKLGATTQVTGGTGIGKSVFTEQLACHVATGKPLFGRIKVHHPARVLYLEAENDNEILKRDMSSIVAACELPVSLIKKNLEFRRLPCVPMQLYPEVLDRMLSKFKPELLILDPYQSFIGSVDIVSTQAFFEWKAVMEALIAEHNFALVIVAHAPKPRERDGWNDRDLIYLSAGTSTVNNWVRTGCELLPVENELNMFKLHFSKAAEYNGLSAKDGPIVREMFIEHSANVRGPYWRLCASQKRPMKLGSKGIVAKTWIDHPDWSIRRVAEECGVSKGMAERGKPK
jgi:hypothetical protein